MIFITGYLEQPHQGSYLTINKTLHANPNKRSKKNFFFEPKLILIFTLDVEQRIVNSLLQSDQVGFSKQSV